MRKRLYKIVCGNDIAVTKGDCRGIVYQCPYNPFIHDGKLAWTYKGSPYNGQDKHAPTVMETGMAHNNTPPF